MPDADAAPAREPLPALPTDVWQIIARFAEPVSAAATRHLAAPARTLHEHVQHKLDSNKDEWHDRTHAQDDVDRTQHCLKLLNTLRTVSTEWRDIVNYRSTCEIALKSDACLRMPTDIGTRFGGCETLTIDGFGDRDNYVHRYTPRAILRRRRKKSPRRDSASPLAGDPGSPLPFA